jgi:hypothetical protein
VSCHLFGGFEGFGGVLVRLLGELMSSEVITFAVGGSCGAVGMGGFVVVFGCAIVRALRHDVLLVSLDADSSATQL